MTAALYTLAIARVAFGTSLLLAPLLTSAACLIPVAPIATLGLRLAGSRDLTVGALLLYSIRAQQSSRDALKADDVAKQPLINQQKPSLAGPSDRSELVRAALMAGIAIDGIDMLSTAACFMEGNLPLDGALVAGGGAALLTGFGMWNLMRLPGQARQD